MTEPIQEIMFPTVPTLAALSIYLSKDAKQKAALKAKLRRLCEYKRNHRLQVPEWLHKQWKENAGNHLEMALQFQKTGFNKDLLPPFFQCQATISSRSHSWKSQQLPPRMSLSRSVRRPTQRLTVNPIKSLLDGIPRVA